MVLHMPLVMVLLLELSPIYGCPRSATHQASGKVASGHHSAISVGSKQSLTTVMTQMSGTPACATLYHST